MLDMQLVTKLVDALKFSKPMTVAELSAKVGVPVPRVSPALFLIGNMTDYNLFRHSDGRVYLRSKQYAN